MIIKFKIFEGVQGTHIPKFKNGTPVKIKNDDTNTFYVISGYDYRKNRFIKDLCRLQKYEDRDKFADREGFFSWILEDELELISEYELSANKYNL